MRKTIGYTATVWILALLFFTGCASTGAYQKSFYDDDEKIAAQGDSYTFILRVGSTKKDSTALSFKGFTGKQTVWSIDAQGEGAVNLTLDVDIDSGRFKVCLVSPDGLVTVVAENTQEDAYAIPITKGKSRIVIVGDEAKGDVAASLTLEGELTVRTEDD